MDMAIITDLRNSHVMSALVKKFIDARDDNDDKVEVWGDGSAQTRVYLCDEMFVGL